MTVCLFPYCHIILATLSVVSLPHHGASVSLSAADVHQHEERRDEQGHASWHHLNWYEKSDEGGDGQ